MSVIHKNEPVTLARCPACSGTAFVTITRYMTAEDLSDLARLTERGFTKHSMPLNQSSSIHSCECSPESIKAAAAPRPAPRPTGKPVLSLGRKAS